MMKFKRFELTGVVPRPEWWRVRPEEISADCTAVRKGKTEVIAETPAGFPVYAVTYNDFRLPRRRINWSSASATRHPELYGNGDGAPQTLLIAAGIHGCEVEGVVVVSNLMRLLETGRDWRGQERPELLKLARHYRLVLLPCVNMDGRAISPDHRIGADLIECRKAGGGIAADGQPIRWPAMKEHFPLPLDQVQYPGGYPNSAGYNIMHDATPGNFRTAEAAALCRLADEVRADFFLNLHSQPEGADVFTIQPQTLGYPANQVTEREYQKRLSEALTRAGIPNHSNHDSPPSPCINLNTIVSLSCGAPTVTVEFASRLAASFDQVLEAGYIVLETAMRMGLEKPFVDRATLIRGKR